MLRKLFTIITILSLLSLKGNAQDSIPRKTINHNIQSWIGVFGTYKFNDKWGITGDLLTQRHDLVNELSWYWIRVGGMYWLSDHMAVTSAYAQLWQYQPTLLNKKFTLEHRSDHQITSTYRLFNFFVFQRFRADLRWRETIINNYADGRDFSVRPRYMYSIRIPLSKNPKIPSLVLANEVLLQFGQRVVYNTFDQFRVFIGIQQNIGKKWSYDFGYFQIYQQTAAGNVYNANHMVRLLVYYSAQRSKSTHTPPMEYYDQDN